MVTGFSQKRPKLSIYIFADAPWTIHLDLGKGVYPLTPVTRTSLVNKRNKVRVRRTCFFLLSDFASTAHMIQGQCVSAAFVDAVPMDEIDKNTDDIQIAAYVMLSRARDPNNLWLL